MENNKTTLVSIIIFVAVIIIAIFIFAPKGGVSSSKYDTFAKCLADKKVTMYGAIWCSHCQAQKAAFLGSFKYVPYVECPDNIQACLDKGVEAYPTWIFPDGQKLVGEQKLEDLANKAGCPIDNSGETNAASTTTNTSTSSASSVSN